MNGFNGKIVRADLTKMTCKIEPLDEVLVKDFLGGEGSA